MTRALLLALIAVPAYACQPASVVDVARAWFAFGYQRGLATFRVTRRNMDARYACDVSEQSAEAAMARLGLQFTAEEIQL